MISIFFFFFFPYFIEKLSGKITFSSMGSKPLSTAVSYLYFFLKKVYLCICYTHVGVIGIFLIIKAKK